jgi:hypothetical protein
MQLFFWLLLALVGAPSQPTAQPFDIVRKTRGSCGPPPAND